MAKVLFSYGLQAKYDALETRPNDTIYFITDTGRIYKGSSLISDVTKLNVEFTSTKPDAASAEENKLYVVTENGSTSFVIKSGDQIVTVGGGEAASVKDGSITFTKFAEGLVAKNLDSADDSTIPTTKAVKDAINTAIATLDAAIVDVTPEAAPAGSTGTVLKFTTKGGETKSVTIADIFLSAASYDTTSHKLTLTVNDAEQSKIDVDLSDLIGSSLSDVKVGEDETFTVELGTGGTLGGFKTGDTIDKDVSMETLIKKLLMKQVPPTYTAPTVSIANNGGSASGSYEIGTSITPNIKATFNKNDAGDLTSIQFQKNGTNVGEAGTTNPGTYTEAASVLEATTKFKAIVSYGEGAIKNDNLGQPYETGHIAAGSKTTSEFTFTPYRQGYFVGSTTNTDEVTSATVRSFTKKNGAYSSGTVKFTVPAGAARVMFLCPMTNTGVTKVLNESALNADVTNTFVKSTIDVEGADGYSAITYNAWTFVPAVPYAQDAVLAFTLG